jgi:murein DD-endopeptidase MepM/ murein hydrolase activator NlpD
MGQLSVALSATSPDDFATKIAMADTVMSVQNKSLDRLATVQAAATAQKAHVAALRRDVARAKVAAEKALAAATTARAAAASAKVQLDRLAAQQTRQAAAVRARKAAEQRRLTAMQAQSNRLRKVLAARARAAKIAAARAKARREAAARAAARRANRPYVPPPPERSDGYLSAPSSAPVSSEYGMRYHPVLHYWRLHAGRDYAANCGSPVFAAASGTIISAGVAGGYGNQLVVAHGVHSGVDLATTYNHLSSYRRTSGRVSRGEVIAYVGTTGTSTGCHLHFETREDGNPVDPRKWL